MMVVGLSLTGGGGGSGGGMGGGCMINDRR